jgi:Leucine-rich repeat (LRR) protein
MASSSHVCLIALSTLVACATDEAREGDGMSPELSRSCFVPICEAALESPAVSALSAAPVVTSPDRALVEALLNAAGTTSCTVAAQELLAIDEIPYALRRSDITSLDALGCFTHFKRLNFYSNDIVDLSPLSNMSQLESLSLASNRQLETIAPLAGLPRLARLFVRYTSVRDLDSLEAARSTLRFLDVSGATTVTGEQIARFGELRTLIAQNTTVEGRTLASLTKLATLDLWSSQLVDVQPGSFPESLRELTLSFSDIADAAVLAPLHGLVTLDASYTDMTGWAALSGLTGLRNLLAARTRIGEDGGLGFLSPWTDLETIDVSEAGITDAYALAGKPLLRSVNLHGNALASPPDVSSSPELESLLLDDNALHDVSSLVGLTWVPTIYIGHNPVTKGLCDLARSRTDRPQTLPRFQGSPGFDHDIIDAIAACR